jgi:hypothetical protein
MAAAGPQDSELHETVENVNVPQTGKPNEGGGEEGQETTEPGETPGETPNSANKTTIVKQYRSDLIRKIGQLRAKEGELAPEYNIYKIYDGNMIFFGDYLYDSLFYSTYTTHGYNWFYNQWLDAPIAENINILAALVTRTHCLVTFTVPADSESYVINVFRQNTSAVSEQMKRYIDNAFIILHIAGINRTVNDETENHLNSLLQYLDAIRSKASPNVYCIHAKFTTGKPNRMITRIKVQRLMKWDLTVSVTLEHINAIQLWAPHLIIH